MPYSIPGVGDYSGEYPFHCNFSVDIFHMSDFPLPSPGLVRRLVFLTKKKIVLTKARFDLE